jgi:hypothetical protein
MRPHPSFANHQARMIPKSLPLDLIQGWTSGFRTKIMRKQKRRRNAGKRVAKTTAPFGRGAQRR